MNFDRRDILNYTVSIGGITLLSSCGVSASSENQKADSEPESFGFIRTPSRIAVSGSGRYVALNDEFGDASELILVDLIMDEVRHITTGDKKFIVNAPCFSFDEKFLIISVDSYDYFPGTQFWKIELATSEVTVFKWSDRTYAKSPTFINNQNDFVYFRHLDDLASYRSDIQLSLTYGLFGFKVETAQERQLHSSGWNEFNELWPVLDSSEVLFRGIGERVKTNGRWNNKSDNEPPRSLIGISFISDPTSVEAKVTKYNQAPEVANFDVLSISKTGQALIVRDLKTSKQRETPIWSPNYSDGPPSYLETAKIDKNNIIYTPRTNLPRVYMSSFGGVGAISDNGETIVLYVGAPSGSRSVPGLEIYSQSAFVKRMVLGRPSTSALLPVKIIGEVVIK